MGDLDLTILYLYNALEKSKELLNNNIIYIDSYIAIYKRYIEAYKSKSLYDIVPIIKNRFLRTLKKVYKNAIRENIKNKIEKYIEELNYAE